MYSEKKKRLQRTKNDITRTHRLTKTLILYLRFFPNGAVLAGPGSSPLLLGVAPVSSEATIDPIASYCQAELPFRPILRSTFRDFRSVNDDSGLRLVGSLRDDAGGNGDELNLSERGMRMRALEGWFWLCGFCVWVFIEKYIRMVLRLGSGRFTFRSAFGLFSMRCGFFWRAVGLQMGV